MHSMAPRPCFFMCSRARSVRYFFNRSQLMRCCQSNPAMPKFAVPMVSPELKPRGIAVGENPSRVAPCCRNNMFGEGTISFPDSRCDRTLRGRSRPHPRSARVLAGIGLEASRLDPGDRAGLVALGCVAGNADGADDVTCRGSDRRPALAQPEGGKRKAQI